MRDHRRIFEAASEETVGRQRARAYLPPAISLVLTAAWIALSATAALAQPVPPSANAAASSGASASKPAAAADDTSTPAWIDSTPGTSGVARSYAVARPSPAQSPKTAARVAKNMHSPKAAGASISPVAAATAVPTRPAAVVPAAEGYVLQQGDVIQVKHLNHPELNELLPIRPDGRISLELVGEVGAAGLATSQLQALLAQKYSSMLRNPDLAVIVKEFGGNKVYVGGEVNQPGIVRTTGVLTLLQAVMEAGGFKNTAQLKNVVILRNQGTDQPAFQSVNVKRLLSEPTQGFDMILKPYDIVFVPKSRVSRMSEFVGQYVNQVLPIPAILGLSYAFGLR